MWKDQEGEVQYFVPKELKILTIAEKMLMQVESVVIPLQHIKHGITTDSTCISCDTITAYQAWYHN